MVEWEAANLSSSSYDGEGESDDNSSYQDSNNQKQRSKRRRTRTAGTSETPEAAIARLTSAYNAAMTAVGALHKATNSIAKRRKKRNKTKEKIDDDIILEGGGKDKGKDKDKDKDVIMDEKQEDDKEKGDKDALCAAASDAHEKDSEMKDVGEGEVTNEAASKCGDDTSTEELLSLKRIALAARHAFEKAVLSDPLIAPYAPTVSRTMQEMDKEKNTQRYNEPAVSISKAHKITVKELAYLSLVNYADLILSCCSNGLHGKGLFNDILDRGAVRTLNSIINREECHDSNSSAMNTSLCMWKDIEKEEDSKKLALVSYCDAADLDGSDPTTWLKVACAARSLGRVFQQKQFIETSDNSIDITLLNAVKDNLSYSRLERYALERGLTTLRPGIPCNRAIHRAFREFEENILASQESYISFQKICNKGKDNLIIDLPRYSWSTLGRLLLQACRSVDTGTIHLKISPMLTLPKIALGLVCEYLGLYHGDGNGDVSADVKKLEATCRALSVDIISARALIEKERNLRLKKIEQEMHEILENENNAEEPTIESDTNTNTKNSNFQDESMKQNRANRTSKRVQSQLITSGKQAERSAKRKSVEYCLWCSIIPCTTENPIYSTLVGEFRWEKLESFRGYSKLSKQFFIQNGDDNDMPIVGNNNDNNTASMKNLKDTINTNVQGGDASLNECINRWSASKVGAFDMLHRFLAHISCHIDEICLTEQGGAMVLTSCILECFEILAGRGKDSYSTLSPPWYGELTFSLKRNDNTTIAIETLAINLLSAELQMRACERQVNVSNTLFDKCHRVKMMLPYLMQYASSLGECNMSSLFRVIVSKLQIRTHWLVGIFYIWWSKNTPKLGDKKQAEKIALEHIDNVISLLKGSDPAITIKTPQLVSPGRSGIHWSELSVRTSTMFRNELESSTVLSHCRQKFFDLLASWKKSGYSLTSDFSEDDKGQLQSIGCELFQRYQLGDIKMATGEKTDELIEDFITLHMSDLVPTASGDNEIIVPNRWPSLWNHIPTSQVPILFDDLSNPSFITMMSLSLLSKSNYRMYQACLIGSLTLAVIKKRVKVLVQIKTSRERCTKNSIEKGNSSDDDSSVENEGEDRDLDPQKVNTLVQMTYFLLSKFWDLLIEATEEELHDIMNLVDIAPLIQLSIEVSSGHCQQYMDKIDKHVIEVPQSLDLLKSSMLFASMINKKLVDETSRRKFTSQLFASLCAIVVRERSVLPYLSPKRSTNLGKSECQKLCLTRSHYISVVASEIAALLSCHQNTYSAEHVEESFLIKDLLTVENENISGSRYTLCPLAKLAESLAWFWTFLSNADTRISSCLRIPIAALIATLIGSSGHANSNTIMLEFSRLSDQQSREHSSLFSLSDYFESDDSAKGCVGQDKDGTSETKMSGTQRLILHALCRGVQCIGLVFSGCDETELSSIQNCAYCQTNNGYFLPLIIVRVLGGISDFVLNEFSESNDSSSGLWSEEYPFGFRSAGAQLDALLYKAYRCLHGIHLSSQNNHLSTSKDYAVPPPCVTLIDQTYFPPESVKASAQLYRCIMRAYTGGRRTIPVNSLECVLSALPHAEENASLANMKKYLYQKVDYQPSSTVEDISNVLELQSDIFDEMSKELPEWILNEDCSIGEGCVKDEVYIVRKGICEYFTENPLPGLGSSTFSSKPEESRIAKERGIASQVERAVYKKFTYIMESLTHDPRDASKWYRMGLCIGLKIDTIIDRLTQTHQCYNANDFYLKGYHSAEDRQSDFLKVYHDEPLPLVPLLEKQCAAYTDLALKKECILGSDFSMYLESQWSSYSSLQDFSSRLGSHLRQRRKSGLENKDEIDKEFSHWSMIQSKFDEGNIAEWQFHLGRMFAMSLQAMREKCFRVAFFLSMNTKSKENEDMHPEIAESLGTMYYSDIGFSLRKLTSFEKRQKSKLAQLFFQRALDLILQTEEEHDLAEYEIQVMIGKCQEKIAKTLESEACSTTHDRMYKLIISKALESYNKALIAAQKYEEKHGTMDIQAGGSAHGIIELIYRLHASRLKVLLRAIRKPQDEREMAETEALVITEAHWFEQPKNPTSECKVQNIRERVWAILADIVESMVHCRREQSFFHRSVYRHAQALLWAPLFHDPDGSIKDGSLATVPAHKSYRLRGLNSGSCAKSAEALLNSLFDKKRPQLCAVWVTTPPSPSPFEYMNDSKRKFDRIRWKYIGAFIDCMRLCRGRATLENFIKWCHASSLDLPSFYDLTATEEGEPPQNSHSGANLLLAGSGLTHFAKTYANGAVADIICREVTELRRQESSDFEWKKGVTELMGSAYKSFLRLNCPIDGCLWQSTKVKHQLYNGDIPEVEALCNAFMALNGIKSSSSLLVPWEQKVLLLRFAVKEAQKMFPAIVINSVTLNKRKRKRKACSGNDGNKEMAENEETASQKIIVKVPSGLKEGEKFLVTITCGYFRRKVQLVATGTRKIAFDLDVPKSAGSDIKIIKH